MPERATKAGSFSAYLEAELKWQRKRQAQPKASAIDLLGILAAANEKELPVSELMSSSGMGFIEYAEAVKNLEAAGMITVSGAAGDEVVKLSPKGEEVALLSRPA